MCYLIYFQSVACVNNAGITQIYAEKITTKNFEISMILRTSNHILPKKSAKKSASKIVKK